MAVSTVSGGLPPPPPPQRQDDVQHSARPPPQQPQETQVTRGSDDASRGSVVDIEA